MSGLRNKSQSGEGGLIFVAQWTSAVGAPQLARLLRSQDPRDAEPRPAAAGCPPTAASPTAYASSCSKAGCRSPPGCPPSASWPRAFGVSRTTVAAAYEALRAEGFLESRRGSGSWTAVPAGNPLPTRGLEPLPPEAAGSMIDLGCAALPAPEPWLTRAFQGAMADLPLYAHTHGDYPAGLPVLRQALADRYTARGIPTMPEQIMVTTGAMGAVAAICRLCTGPGERVAVDSPSYANILQLMRDAGARLVPVALGERLAGWDLPAWRQVMRDAAPRMAYVVADFHNPTGTLASEDQRRRLVDAARSAGTLLVVDETMAELRLDEDTEPPRPVCAFDPAAAR